MFDNESSLFIRQEFQYFLKSNIITFLNDPKIYLVISLSNNVKLLQLFEFIMFFIPRYLVLNYIPLTIG